MRRPRRQTVQATVTADRPIDEVSSATPERGTPGRPRRLYGGERVTDDWVSVTKVELPVATGEFADGSSTFTLPSWAPGSSSELAQWSARLTIHRGGRHIDTRGDFNVVIGTADLMVTDEPQQRINGDGETAVDIVLPTLLHRAGETSQVIKLGNGIPLRNGTPRDGPVCGAVARRC